MMLVQVQALGREFKMDSVWKDWDVVHDKEEAVRLATAVKHENPTWTVRIVEEVIV